MRGRPEFYLDMTSDSFRVTRSVYVMVLRKDIPSPLAPQSDEEKVSRRESRPAPAKPEAKQKMPAATTVQIDFDHISQRILSLPIPAGNYTDAGGRQSRRDFPAQDIGRDASIHAFSNSAWAAAS